MSKVFGLLGDNFINKDGNSIALESVKGEGKIIAVYFSAHWCPPCRTFTPKLATFYNSVKQSQQGSQFELIFVSSDKTDEEFSKYLAEMPWYALPYAKRSEKVKLSKYFKVSGIPTLIFLDGETGKAINKNGRSVVDANPDGQGFPWKAKTLHDILKQGQYTNNKDEKKSFEEDIKDKVLGIYFSAHWCPPCKAFTPMLTEVYKKINANEKKFEIIFVSSDQNEAAFKEYFNEMPFLSLPYDSDIKDELSETFEVEGIPTLIILDERGTIITSSGRAVVSGDKEGKKFPWHPEPVEDLDEVSGPKINEEACLVYLPAGDEEASEQMKTILTPIGESIQSEAKSEDRLQDLYLFVAPATPNPIIESLCDFLGLEKNTKMLFILDIPSGKIYNSESAEPVKEDVEKFVRDYNNDVLPGADIRN